MRFFNFFPLVSFFLLLLIIAGRIFYLGRKGIKISSKKEKRKIFLYPLFLIIVLLWFFEILKPAFQINFSVLPEAVTTTLTDSNYIKIAGAFITFFALILWTLTLLQFKTSIRFGLNAKNKGKLVTTGVFAISRNPFFLSLDLYFLGISMILPNLFFIFFAVLTIVSIHLFILKEEKFMRKVYGDEYENYSKKVSRYF